MILSGLKIPKENVSFFSHENYRLCFNSNKLCNFPVFHFSRKINKLSNCEQKMTVHFLIQREKILSKIQTAFYEHLFLTNSSWLKDGSQLRRLLQLVPGC
jgi:hypothetical protein